MWLTAAPTPPPLISLSLAGRNAGEQLRAVNKPSRTSLREQLFGPAQDLSLCLDSIRFDSTPEMAAYANLGLGIVCLAKFYRVFRCSPGPLLPSQLPVKIQIPGHARRAVSVIDGVSSILSFL